MVGDRAGRRQELDLGWRWRPLAAAEESDERRRFAARQASRELARGERAARRRGSGDEWPQLWERLERLELKLDRVQQLLERADTGGQAAFRRVWSSLDESGALLRLEADWGGEVAQGQLWSCELLLPGDAEPVELLARVKASHRRDAWQEVELTFEEIGEQDRDRLGRMLFQLERQRGRPGRLNGE